VTDEFFDRLPAFHAQAEMLREPHNAASVTPYVVAAFAADADVLARIAVKQKAALDAALEAEYEVPTEAIRAAAAARRCLWSPRMEDHPDGESCDMCLKAAKAALDASAPLMLAPLQAKIAVQDKAIAAALDFADSIGRSLSREGAPGTEADYALFGYANQVRTIITDITGGTS
jgi:hypothetical protein